VIRALAAALALAASACSTLGGFQEARVEEKRFSALVGIATQGYSHRGAGNPYYDREGQLLPSLDLAFRYGFNRWLEGGLLLSSFVPALDDDTVPTGIGVEVKAQVARGERFDAALQAGYRHARVALLDRDYDVRIGDLFLGGLLTWSLSPSARVTLAPRVAQRRYRPFDVDPAAPAPPPDTGSLAGALLTFSLGRRVRVLPEVGWFTTDGVDVLHGGLAVAWIDTP
jgi:hypothetical protein